VRKIEDRERELITLAVSNRGNASASGAEAISFSMTASLQTFWERLSFSLFSWLLVRRL
jgi:hypothetical protein